jgi:hypothetical protein
VHVVLLSGIGGILASFIISARTEGIDSARYLIFAAVYGSVALARWTAISVASGRWRSRVLMPACLVCLVASIVSLGINSSVAPPATPQSALASWLAAHTLTRGYAPYWFASIVTLDSGNKVQVEPIYRVGDGSVHGYVWNMSTTSYEPSTAHPALFVVWVRPGSKDAGLDMGINRDTAVRTFGMPQNVYESGEFEVLVWGRDLSPTLLHRGLDILPP